MIRRGTTPTHTFTIPFDVSFLKAVSVIYSQNDIKIITKKKADCVLEGKKISVTLTQAETLKLKANTKTQVQIRVLTTSGDALSTTIESVGTADSLSEEVLV